jgi:hypothetical protein
MGSPACTADEHQRVCKCRRVEIDQVPQSGVDMKIAGFSLYQIEQKLDARNAVLSEGGR